jgi:integrase
LGEFVAPSTVTFGELLDLWLGGKCGNISERTHSDYSYTIKTYIKPDLGSIRASQLTTDRLKQHYEKMRERGLTNRTLRLIHIVIKAVLREAVDQRKLARNPATSIQTPRKSRQITICFFKPDEARIFREAAETDRHGTIFLFALETGMRPEEYLALRWTDLDWVKGHVIVSRTLSWPREGVYKFIETTKTKKSYRTLPLSSELLGKLRDHYGSQIVLKKSMLEQGKWDDHDLIFSSDGGTPYFLHNLARYFKRLLANAKLDPKMRLYDLRHSCATLMLSSGVNAKIVSERLGHASVAFTLDTYCHVLPNEQSLATEVLTKVLGYRVTGESLEGQKVDNSIN